MINGVDNNLGIGKLALTGGKSAAPSSGASFADTLKQSIDEFMAKVKPVVAKLPREKVMSRVACLIDLY